MRNADSAGHNLLEFSLVSEISLFARLKPFLVYFFYFFQRGRGEKKKTNQSIFLSRSRCFQVRKLKDLKTGNPFQKLAKILRDAVKFTSRALKAQAAEHGKCVSISSGFHY